MMTFRILVLLTALGHFSTLWGGDALAKLSFPWEETHEPDQEWVTAGLSDFPTPRKRPNKAIYRSVPGHGKVIAMTFDDGPRPWTNDVLDALKKRNLRATFFVVGTEAATYPKIVQRMIAEGHEVANHTLTHKNNYLHRAPRDVVEREIVRGHEAIVKITGVAPKVFRPPGGNFTDEQSKWIHDAFGYANVLWSVDPGDGRKRKPSTAIFRSRVLAQVRGGAIILAHDLHRSTVAAVPSTLDALTSRGYRFVTVSELLALDDPFRDLAFSPEELETLSPAETDG